MHIEKNVCENIVGTLLGIDGKNKDGLNARFDLMEMGIRNELHPTKQNEKWIFPAACYSMSLEEKSKICTFLKKVKVPDGYSSNISHCVNVKDRKITGLKSHDCHILLENLLPLAIRGVAPNNVYDAITELSIFFRELCSKVLIKDVLDGLESQISVTLCKLEMIFPPTFFDVMVHLVIHLATEAKLGGPVQYRWMYPIERFLRILKCYVRNKYRPEGSIAEGYIVEESLLFCSRYLDESVTKFNQLQRNTEFSIDHSEKGLSVFIQRGYPIGSGKPSTLEENLQKQAHLYVLRNTEEVQPFLNEFDRVTDGTNFEDWFRNQILEMHKGGNSGINRDMLSLARGPLHGVHRYNGFVINGFRFHTKQLEEKRRKQNSGVLVRGFIGDESSTNYFGVLTEIIELQYLHGKRVVMFKCDWWDVDSGRGIHIDKHDYVSVNTIRKLATNEPFVLASQAEQVFYVADGLKPNWLVVLDRHSEYLRHLPIDSEAVDQQLVMEDEALQQNSPRIRNNLSTMQDDHYDDSLNWGRTDIRHFIVDAMDTDKIVHDANSDYETDSEDLLL